MPKSYRVTNATIEDLLSWIKQGIIALPEMQRPFVWSSSKVRDLIDSLYNGYPIGYIVTWQNPTANLKDKTTSENKKIIIDGQQRLTALKAALDGEKIITKQYESERIAISFKPSTEEFATLNAAIKKDPLWINDIAQFFNVNYSSFSYITENAERLKMEPDKLGRVLQKLSLIQQAEIGNIELDSELTIDEVTDIFNRINSTGTSLSSADLVMSRLSADKDHGGNNLRKQIEYFVQLINDPTLISNIKKLDPEFCQSSDFENIKWIANEDNPIYRPNYSDLLHVILAVGAHRGKLSDMVSLISGRNFEKRNYSEASLEDNYKKIKIGADKVFNKSNYQRYLMILRDMGMRNSRKLGLVGHGALNFGYIFYLLLCIHTKFSKSEIDSYVKRWIVMSALTGRYSGSSETAIESDLRLLSDDSVIEQTLAQALSDDFWSATLPESFNKQSTQSTSWRVFQMAQTYSQDTSWLSKDTSVETVMLEEGNIHHIFPRAYLERHGFSKGRINQIANFVWITQPKNLEIKDNSPKEYLHDAKVTEFETVQNNKANAMPDELNSYDYHDYDRFLEQRRHLMAKKIKDYYSSL